MAELYTTLGQSTLLASINSVAVSLTVLAAASFPPTGSFRIRIDDEIMQVTAVSGDDFAVVRGTEGTTAAGHLANAAVIEVLTAAALTAILAQSQGLRFASVVLSPSDIENLNSTPFELIPAPGSGFFIRIVPNFSCSYRAGATPFQSFSGVDATALEVFFTGLVGGLLAILLTTEFLQADSSVGQFSCESLTGNVENLAVVLGFPEGGGRVLAASVGDAGLGYLPGDSANTADSIPLVVTIDTVGGLGEVLSFTITDAGAGVFPGPNQSTSTSGAGIGFTINVDSIQTLAGGDGTIAVGVAYAIVAV